MRITKLFKRTVLLTLLSIPPFIVNAQYEVYFKDQLMLTVDQIDKDSLGVTISVDGKTKRVPYQELYAIRSDGETFYYRGRYARRFRKLQPDFYDLSLPFSVGLNALRLAQGRIEFTGSAYANQTRSIEAEIGLMANIFDDRLLYDNRRFVYEGNLLVTKYTTLKRDFRFGFGLGVAYGSNTYDADNAEYAEGKSIEYQKDHLAYSSKALEASPKDYSLQYQLRRAQRRYENAVTNSKLDTYWAGFIHIKLRYMVNPQWSINAIPCFGLKVTSFDTSLRGNLRPGFAGYYNGRLSVNYHFNFKSKK